MTSLSRRDFLRSCALGAAALSIPALRVHAAGAAKRPNILLVVLDDLGWGQFAPNTGDFTMDQVNPLSLERAKGRLTPAAALSAARSAVPTISRLAAGGVRFTEAYVTNSLCAPSRTGLMTSRSPARFGCYVNLDVSKDGVPLDQEFLVGRLKTAGYATGMVGKWHLAAVKQGEPVWGQRHPLDCGFDSYFGFNDHSSEYFDAQHLWRDRQPAKAEGYLTDQFTSEALGFIHRAADKPFFLYLAYNAVHGPLGKPAPEMYRKFNTGDAATDNFYAYLHAADCGLAKILDDLKATGKLDDTLVMLMSDNGAGGSPLPNNGPFYGYKGQPWQGGLHVPMIAWGARFVPAGKVIREPVSSMDLLPTALEAAGAPLPSPAAIDGRSLLPLLAGKQQGPLHESLCWAGELAWVWSGRIQVHDEMTAPPAWAVRKGRWMLHYWADPTYVGDPGTMVAGNAKAKGKKANGKGKAKAGKKARPTPHDWSNAQGTLELYDMETDRGERKNVAAEHPDVVRDLKAAYAAWYQGLRKPVLWPEGNFKALAPHP